jgi:hypothetical protein
LVILVVIVLVVALVGGVGGSSKSKKASDAASAVAQGLQNAHEVAIPPLAGAKGVTASAGLTALGGASMQLAVHTTSQYRVYIELVTPKPRPEKDKSDEIQSEIPGKSSIAHDMTLQHLLGYKYLRVYTLPAGASKYKPQLQIPTVMLAELVIAHQSD